VVLSEQIQPGTFEFALDHLVDHETESVRSRCAICNDETGASAYDPRVMLKIVLLAYSRGLVSNRAIERGLPAKRGVHHCTGRRTVGFMSLAQCGWSPNTPTARPCTVSSPLSHLFRPPDERRAP
jgi:transposase-like protein DUF772